VAKSHKTKISEHRKGVQVSVHKRKDNALYINLCNSFGKTFIFTIPTVSKSGDPTNVAV